MSEGDFLKRDILDVVGKIRSGTNDVQDGGKSHKKTKKRSSRKLIETIFKGGAKKGSRKGSKKLFESVVSKINSSKVGGAKKDSRKKTKKGSRKLFENSVVPVFNELSNIGLNGGKRGSKKGSKKGSKSQKREMPPTMVKANELREFIQKDSGLKGGKPMFKLVWHFINKVKTPEKTPDQWSKEAKALYQDEKKKGSLDSLYNSFI